MMHYELWDTGSGDLVGDDPTAAAAWSIVRDAVRRHGPVVAVTLAPGAEFDDEHLSGGELLARAEHDAADSM